MFKKLMIFTISILTFSQIVFANKFDYGSDGSYQGQEIKSGSNTYRYGSDGSFQGQEINSGGNTHRYGSDGSYQGTEIDSSYKNNASKNSW